MFDKFSLKFKLIAAFMGIASLLLVVGGVSWYSNFKTIESYENIASVNLPNIMAVGKMRYRAQELNRLVLRSTMVKDQEALAKFKKDAEESLKIYNDTSKEYAEIPFAPGEAPIFDKTEVTWKAYAQASLKVESLVGVEGKEEEIRQVIEKEVAPTRVEHDKALNELLKFHEDSAARFRAEASEIATRGKNLMYLVIALGLLLALVAGYIISTVLSKTLSRISTEISGAADQTSAAGNELSAASQQLSEGSSEAASSLEETVASLEELSSMVKLNADNAKEANTLSQASSKSAELGESEISTLINAMEEIAKGSKKIEEIITVIDDIAFQTNLLALNAAVEAARAGEQGKGFAVVAEAVRNLAQKSAEAAKDINTLIKDNVEKSTAGARIAGQSGVVLKDIVTSVKKVTELNSEIATASRDQANGIEQISKAMNQLDQATQGNAASSEEVAASSEEMSSQATLLAQLVVDLRALIQGNGIRSQAMNNNNNSKQDRPKQATHRPTQKPKLVHSKKDLNAIFPMGDEDGDDRSNKIGNASGF